MEIALTPKEYEALTFLIRTDHARLYHLDGGMWSYDPHTDIESAEWSVPTVVIKKLTAKGLIGTTGNLWDSPRGVTELGTKAILNAVRQGRASWLSNVEV